MTEPPNDIRILQALPRRLLGEGYVDACQLVGPLQLRFLPTEAYLPALPPTTRTLVALFFLQRDVPRAALAPVFADEELAALVRLGVLIEVNGSVRTGHLIAVPAHGRLVLSLAPPANPAAFLGDDAIALSHRLQPAPGDRCLVLPAGVGLHTLQLAAAGGSVVAFEPNPVLLACAELNAVMNDLAERIELRPGDIDDALATDDRFDFVCATPPLLPLPVLGPDVLDGPTTTRRILEGLPRLLAPTGAAQLLGVSLGDDDGPAIREQLDALADDLGLRLACTVPSRAAIEPGSKLLEGLVGSYAAATEMPKTTLRRHLLLGLEETGATYLYFYFLAVTRSERPGLLMTEHYRQPGGFWYRTG